MPESVAVPPNITVPSASIVARWSDRLKLSEAYMSSAWRIRRSVAGVEGSLSFTARPSRHESGSVSEPAS